MQAPNFDERALDNRVIAQANEMTVGAFKKAMAFVALSRGDVLFEPGTEQKYAYFPTQGVVSVIHQLRDSASTHLAIVGNDGMIGVPGFLEVAKARKRAVVELDGHAMRIHVDDLRRLAEEDRTFRTKLCHYVQVRLGQLAQTALCNVHHGAEQRLCRWLLHISDLSADGDIYLTQQRAAEMLGVRREGISAVASRLRGERVIEYGRGRLRVINRTRLEAKSCECYSILHREANHLL